MASPKKSSLETEIDFNGQKFADRWSAEIVENITALREDENLVKSYRRITAIQAIKLSLLRNTALEVLNSSMKHIMI